MTVMLVSNARIFAQDYFEFQIRDTSAIQLTDSSLGILYNKEWRLVSKIENRMGKIDTSNSSYLTLQTPAVIWAPNYNISHRLIENKFIIFTKKNTFSKFSYLSGVYSISEFNDTLLKITKHFRSDYKWKITYVFTDLFSFTKLFKKEKEQQDYVYRKLLADEYKNGKTIIKDTTISKNGSIDRINTKIIIVQKGLGDCYFKMEMPIILYREYRKNGRPISSFEFDKETNVE